jgi:predicted  nucleic acid-binding Zn-ribbon protein
MNDFEWISKELNHYQHEEKAAIERIKTAETALAKTKEELVAAKETLAGIRGGIAEFTWQMKYLEENGKLP